MTIYRIRCLSIPDGCLIAAYSGREAVEKMLVLAHSNMKINGIFHKSNFCKPEELELLLAEAGADDNTGVMVFVSEYGQSKLDRWDKVTLAALELSKEPNGNSPTHY